MNSATTSATTSNTPPIDRRNLLKLGLGTAGLLATAGIALADDPTPGQTQGPFHPTGGSDAGVDRRLLQHMDQDSDLTFVANESGQAFGDVVYVTGFVRDEDDRPLQGALVEIWQACVSGKYNHRADPNTDWLDPLFQYWGRASTDGQGRYLFKTIVPGAYRATPGWIRPPHIHFKVSRRGYRELTTQLYFENVRFYYNRRFYPASILPRLNARDQILDGVPADRRASVTAVARAPQPFLEPLPADSQVCPFDIVLRERTVTGSTAGLPAGLR